MNRTLPRPALPSGPVLTFLSRNPAASRRTQSLLRKLVGLEPLSLPVPPPPPPPAAYPPPPAPDHSNNDDGDELDDAVFVPRSLLGSYAFDSRASVCRGSGTVVHLLSVGRRRSGGGGGGGATLPESGEGGGGGGGDDGGSGSFNGSESNELSLLSVTGGGGPVTHRTAAADGGGGGTASAGGIGSSSSSSSSSSGGDGDGDDTAVRAVMASRRFLSDHLRSGSGSGSGSGRSLLLGMRLAACDALGRPATVSQLTGLDVGLPLLDLPAYRPNGEAGTFSGDAAYNDDDTLGGVGDVDGPPYRLREVVVPYFPDSTYPSSSSGDGGGGGGSGTSPSLLTEFAKSGLTRPKVGLYGWPNSRDGRNESGAAATDTTASSNAVGGGGGVAFRPLPAAEEDRSLPPPSLVFQCDNLSRAAAGCLTNQDSSASPPGRTTSRGTSLAKVGFSGDGTGGQLMVRNGALCGLDVRLCDSTVLSSTFAEAQEALLAGSLDDLQSANVMAEGGGGGGGGGNTGDDRGGGRHKEAEGGDAMNGLGDCWVEFRANARNPSGYFRRAGSRRRRVGAVFGAGDGGGAKSETPRRRVAKAPDIPYQ